MKRRTYLTTLGSALLAIAAGCTEVDSMSGEEIGEAGGQTVYRIVDREAGVVIYASAGFEKGGLAVVPLEETNLE